jgi:hypothetical protein
MWKLEMDPEVITLTWKATNDGGPIALMLDYLKQAEIIIEWFTSYVDDLTFVDTFDYDDVYGSRLGSFELCFDQAHLKIAIRFIENEDLAILFKLSCVNRTI